jgi:hypothetical protein
MSQNVQFETDDYDYNQSDADDSFRLVEWLQKNGLADDEKQAQWISLVAAGIIFLFSLYLFSTAFGGSDAAPASAPATTTPTNAPANTPTP